jgi:hypothetical protein
MYNIPTYLCQKRIYLFLTVLVFGPKQSGIDIDVFLEPVMQEFERLWTYGELIYDAFRQEDFTLRAIIFVTINDHPALFALSRQIKGKTGCLVCLDDIKWVFLDGSKKVVYIRNRRFLKIGHKYRSKLYLRYYGNIEENEPPPKRHHNGEHVYKMVKNIRIIYGKKRSDGTIRDRSTPPMPLMLCTCRRMSLRVSLLPRWTQVKGWSESMERHGAAKCDARASPGT